MGTSLSTQERRLKDPRRAYVGERSPSATPVSASSSDGSSLTAARADPGSSEELRDMLLARLFFGLRRRKHGTETPKRSGRRDAQCVCERERERERERECDASVEKRGWRSPAKRVWLKYSGESLPVVNSLGSGESAQRRGDGEVRGAAVLQQRSAGRQLPLTPKAGAAPMRARDPMLPSAMQHCTTCPSRRLWFFQFRIRSRNPGSGALLTSSGLRSGGGPAALGSVFFFCFSLPPLTGARQCWRRTASC
eukprot:scaffold3504_cov240-Pinguiococcus_pyrenoidosus.AAC.57